MRRNISGATCIRKISEKQKITSRRPPPLILCSLPNSHSVMGKKKILEVLEYRDKELPRTTFIVFGGDTACFFLIL